MSDSVEIKIGASAQGADAVIARLVQQQDKLIAKMTELTNIAIRDSNARRRVVEAEAQAKARAEKQAADAAQKSAAEYVNYKRHESAALEKRIETRRNAMQAAVTADRREIESAKEVEIAKERSAQRAYEAWKRYIRREQQDMDNVAREVKRKRDEQDKSVKQNAENLNGAIVGAAQSAAGFITAFASVQTIADFLGTIRDRMRGIAEESDRTANAMRSVAIQVPKGPEGQKQLQAIALQGAKAGLSPEETGTIANTLQSIPGADVTKELGTAGVLRNLNIEGQDIAPIIQAGVVRGMGGQRAGDLAVRASELAPFEARDVAKYLPKTVKYSSLEAGLAAGTTLRSAGVVSEQIPYAVEALGRALSEDKSPLARKFKLKGKSESERIAILNAAADASGDREKFIRALPEKYKTGEEEGRALQMVLSQKGKFGQDEATLKAMGAGVAQDRLTEQLLKNPKQADEIQARRARELFAYNEVYGAAGDRARATRSEQQSAGLQLQKDIPAAGAVGLVGADGQPTKYGQAWRALQQQGGGSGVLGAARTFFQGGTNFIDIGKNLLQQNGIIAPAQQGANRDQQLGELVSALNANTEATKANTGATGGGETAAPSIAQRRNR